MLWKPLSCGLAKPVQSVNGANDLLKQSRFYTGCKENKQLLSMSVMIVTSVGVAEWGGGELGNKARCS